MTIEERICKLDQAIQMAKNDCHVPSGPTGGQFCATGAGGGSGGGGVHSKYSAGTFIAGSSYPGAAFKVTPEAADTIRALHTLQPRSPTWGVYAKDTAGANVAFRRKEPGSIGSSKVYHQVYVKPNGSWEAARVSGKGSGGGHYGVFWRTQNLGEGTDATALAAFKF